MRPRAECAPSAARCGRPRRPAWTSVRPWLGPRCCRPIGLPGAVGLAALLLVLFVAVAGGAYPVVRRLTRRLEALKQGVEAFGAGALDHRMVVEGKDEVAAVAASFNRAATRIEALVRSHQNLLANASHELRSPLARLKMAVQMLEDAAPAQRAGAEARDRHQHRRAGRAGRGGAAGRPAGCRRPAWTSASRWTCWARWPKRRPAWVPTCRALGDPQHGAPGR